MRSWMRENLTTQGFCLDDGARSELWLGLRFSTGLCLVLVVLALALASPVLTFALVGVGVVAGFTARHPFDLAWNHGVRHVVGGPPLPRNPPRRRHAFKVAAVSLSVGATTAASVLGASLVAACALVTATNLCLPSEALAWLERRNLRRGGVAA